MSLSAPEPPPQPNSSPSLWDLVQKDMLERDQFGRRKYGTPIQAFNGRDALSDAYQEALDLVVYIRQAIEERKSPFDDGYRAGLKHGWQIAKDYTGQGVLVAEEIKRAWVKAETRNGSD